MYGDVNIDFYIPLFHGLLFAVLSFLAYAIIYLRRKRRDAVKGDPDTK